jgi:alanine racemase
MSNTQETILYVDLLQLEKNFNYLKSYLNEDTKIIAVVKAFAYGLGDIEIAKKLEALGVNALWVADFEEGVSLRKGGIKIPIIIANPGIKSKEIIIKYNLEPVIYNLKVLEVFGKTKEEINVHIKINSGMNRYGFDDDQIDELLNKIDEYPHLKVKSLCSHLSSSENKNLDPFTNQQIKEFEKSTAKIKKQIGNQIDTHIMNSNGILRFPIKNNTVRMGIALYGISNNPKLKQICTLESTISQIRLINKNQSVGYQNSFVSSKKMKIAIIPIGYADGINRKLGEGNSCIVINQKKCPIIGQISMDSLVVDISHINCEEGDRAIIFSPEHSLVKIAKEIETIPYEVMATLNRRIKRIYLEE